MILILFAGLILVDVFGSLIYNLILPEAKLLEKISLGFLIGVGLLTLVLFILNLVGVPYSSTWSNFVLIMLTFFVLILNYIFGRKLPFRRSVINMNSIFGKLTGIEVFFVSCILILCASSLLYTLYWPIKDWDTLVLYDFRAITFVRTGFMYDGIARGYFFGYPLFTSLAHTWIYSLGGQNPYFFYSLLYMSFVVAVFCMLLRFMSRKLALFWTIISAIPAEIYIQSTFAYTNLPYTIYFVLGCLFLILWEKFGEKRYIVLSAMLIGLSTWVRSTDPFWIIPLVLTIVFAFARRRYLDVVIYSFLFLLMRQPWLVFEKLAGDSGDTLLVVAPKLTTILLSIPNLDHLIKVTIFIWNNVLIYQIYLLIPLVSSTLIVLLLKKKLTRALFITLSLVLTSYLFIFIGTYVFSFIAPYWEEIADSATRMSIMLIPLTIFGISLNWATIFSSGENS